ncbi:MAG: HXXEE domain-containing protein [Alphaproteobacteria bacterium]|nr:HXXEE domain-containing protein [Alphaproteobacteria bacterium]
MSAVADVRAPARGEAVSFYRLIWLMPAAFALHICEEWFGGFANWVTHVVGGEMSPSTFLVNNAGFMAVLVALTTLAGATRKGWAVFLLMFWASANLFWDFLFHVFTVPLFDRYSPGLLTATLLYFPSSYLVARAALAERVLPPALFTLACGLGAALMGFVIWAGLYHFTV